MFVGTFDIEDVAGWFLVGPMVAVCVDHAGSAEEAQVDVDGTVYEVVPIPKGGRSPLADDVKCVKCGKMVVRGDGGRAH